MQQIPLNIVAGTTMRLTVRVMQPLLAYCAIDAIEPTAPVRLSADHGLTQDWPVYVRGASGMPALNADPVRQLPHLAKVIDDQTLEINALSATGLKPKGGELIYHLPVDLAGAELQAKLLAQDGSELFAIPANAVGLGVVELHLTPEQTANIAGAHSWALDIAQGDDIYRAAHGTAKVWPAGSSPACLEGAYVVTAGAQGPRGPIGPAAVWGAITGNLLDQHDLAQLLAQIQGAIPQSPADLGAATAAQGAKADTAVQPDDLAEVATSGSYNDLADKPVLGTAAAAAAGDFATAVQGAKADTAVQPAALTSALAGKVDKVAGKGLTEAEFTNAEKSKLAALESSRWKGVFTTLAALTAGVPSPQAGDYAEVDSGAGADTKRYIWDASDSKWVAQSGDVPALTAAQVKSLYESNPDTYAFTGAEKTKLDEVAAQATKNDTDANLKSRANHTGTQAISTVTGLQAALDSKLGATAKAADSDKLNGQSASYYATAAQVGDIAAALDAINGEVIV